MSHRVAITGLGAITALGDHWPEIKTAICSNKNAVQYMSDWDKYAKLGTRLGAPVDHFSLPDSYTKKKRRGMGRVAQMAAVATEKALLEAGLLGDDIIRNGECGISYGSAMGSPDAAMEFFDMLANHSMDKLNSTSYLRMMSHTAAVNLSVLFQTSGRMYTTSSACTSGSQGIGYAYEAIRSGQQTVMITGGAEELCASQASVFDTVYSASQFNDAPNTSPRPFDASRDGLVLGEGACTLILEDYDHARARGAKVFGEVVGFATNTDGSHLLKPNKDTMTKVMRMALKSAGLSGREIGYISGHGTATTQGDLAESHATHAAMGSHIPFSGLKGYFGHTLGASGAIEAWLSLHMMNEGWFAHNLNLKQIDEHCADLDYIVDTPRQIECEYFMSNNFAFGGVNTSLVFRRASA